jgi:hypothetical protein
VTPNDVSWAPDVAYVSGGPPAGVARQSPPIDVGTRLLTLLLRHLTVGSGPPVP